MPEKQKVLLSKIWQMNCKYSTPLIEKIENGQTKLTVERLMQIAAIIGTSATKLLNETQLLDINDGNIDDYQNIKELAENHAADLRSEIAYLKTEIDFLQELVKK